MSRLLSTNLHINWTSCTLYNSPHQSDTTTTTTTKTLTHTLGVKGNLTSVYWWMILIYALPAVLVSMIWCKALSPAACVVLLLAGHRGLCRLCGLCGLYRMCGLCGKCGLCRLCGLCGKCGLCRLCGLWAVWTVRCWLCRLCGLCGKCGLCRLCGLWAVWTVRTVWTVQAEWTVLTVPLEYQFLSHWYDSTGHNPHGESRDRTQVYHGQCLSTRPMRWSLPAECQTLRTLNNHDKNVEKWVYWRQYFGNTNKLISLNGKFGAIAQNKINGKCTCLHLRDEISIQRSVHRKT